MSISKYVELLLAVSGCLLVCVCCVAFWLWIDNQTLKRENTQLRLQLSSLLSNTFSALLYGMTAFASIGLMLFKPKKKPTNH